MKKLIPLFIFLNCISAFGQDYNSDNTFYAVDTLRQDFGLFESDSILHIALHFDINEYVRKRSKDHYMNALLTYYINDHDSVNRQIKLRSRGVFRNSYCSFPPLSINFGNADTLKRENSKTEKVKVVTHCQTGNEVYLFKEYLIYKLFNILTEYSFKVRLARVEYINTGRKSKTISTYCFFIEPFDRLTRRTNTVPVNSTTLRQTDMIPGMMDRMTIFNYMIGNTDWTITYQHNCKIITGVFPDYPGLGIPVPYDFDYSGLVDASYAVPAEPLGLGSVRERRYLGLCRTRDAFLKALAEFSEKKAEFYDLINNFPYLTEKDRKSMINYLDEFYALIDRRNTIIDRFLQECGNF